MPPQGRLGDKSMVPADAHGCPACPHPCVGPAIQGSPDVFTNSRPSVRVGDKGIHAACCGPNTWTAAAGSGTVFINNKAAHRLGDADTHCGGSGKLIEGSSNVITGG
ncbi:MAG: repeat-containing protein [Myxococcales bacterium]|nr:repeat-containing protein [Myxococcales bacterium]